MRPSSRTAAPKTAAPKAIARLYRDASSHGWPLIARMLAEAVAGNTATLDKLTGLGSLASTSEDPQVRAGKTSAW